MAGLYPAFPSTTAWSSEVRFVCKLFYCWNECEFDVELSWILSGQFQSISTCLFVLYCINFRSYNFTLFFFIIYCQIAKLSMIPVSCFLEVVLDNVRYSRDTKLSILVVLLGVAVCTVTDVSVNAKGFIAAVIAVWSTSLQQYVSNSVLNTLLHMIGIKSWNWLRVLNSKLILRQDKYRFL